MKWWKRLGKREQERSAEPRPAPPPAEEKAPSTALWIEPLEERIVVGVIWGS